MKKFFANSAFWLGMLIGLVTIWFHQKLEVLYAGEIGATSAVILFYFSAYLKDSAFNDELKRIKKAILLKGKIDALVKSIDEDLLGSDIDLCTDDFDLGIGEKSNFLDIPADNEDYFHDG